MRERLKRDLVDLMLIPGLSGHEDRVRRHIAGLLAAEGLASRADRLGNLIATFPGEAGAPSVMVFTHMDQLGFFVRKIEADGLVRVERMGGVPERALAAQAVLLCVGEGRDVPGVIANKSHHATAPEEKYMVLPDAGAAHRHRATGRRRRWRRRGCGSARPSSTRRTWWSWPGGRIAGTSRRRPGGLRGADGACAAR